MSSSVLRWPDAASVDRSVREWARGARARHSELVRLGYFGSYARGDAGVGSDLDLVAIVSEASASFERRALDWDLAPLPVPAEILVYTEPEWRAMRREGGRFVRTLESETVWI